MKLQRHPLVKYCLLLITAILLTQISACAGGQAPPPEREYWPTDGWRTDAATNHGIDEAILADLRGQIEQEMPFLDSLLIVKDGYLVYEEYFNGFSADQLHHVLSVTKSVLSTLYGMAQAEGKIPNLDSNLAKVFPDVFAVGQFPDKRRITLRHLLQMRSGLEFDETAFYGELLAVGDEEKIIEYFLDRDEAESILSYTLAHRPGENWSYSTMDSNLLSGAFTALTGQSLEEYAGEKLFPVLGIRDWSWPTDDQGVSAGGALLELTPRDMSKLGFLVLNRGVWDGQQVVPESWVKLVTTPQDKGHYAPAGRDMPIEWYGYHWWTWKPQLFGGQRAIAANGYGGQLVVLLPDLDMIVVTTANPSVPSQTAEVQGANIYDLIIEGVLPAVIEKPSPDEFWRLQAVETASTSSLYTAGADGSGRRAFLEEPGYSLWGPAWSPDGQQIVFSRSISAAVMPGSSAAELFTANAGGSNVRQLTNNGRSNFLAEWSPDGRTIAYLSGTGNDWDSFEIYTLHMDTGQETRLTDNDAQEYGITWSPDGSKLAFGTKRDGEMQIYTMNPDGSEQQSTAMPAGGHSPSWSPDGLHIIYTFELEDQSDIMIMDSDGANQRLLIGGPGWDYLPIWSPDGERVAFTSTRDGSAAIYTTAADGSGIEKISGRNLTADVVSWSPDSLKVVFSGAP